MSRDARLSLAAMIMIAQMNPQSAVAAGAIVLVGGIAVGGLFLYEEYKEGLKAEIEREINLINEFYQQHLEKIIVIAGETIGFTAPFEKQEGGGWRSTTWTNAQVVTAGDHALSSIEQKTPLDYYRYHLSEALNLLKTYYFEHTEKKMSGTTIRVVTYLLTIVEKLFGYEGRKVDMAILDGLMRFVLKCAGMRGSHARHFTSLMPVYEHLKEARAKGLRQHQQIWPLEETISELRVMTKRISGEMVRHFVKFTVPKDEWKGLQFVSMDLLASGIKRDSASSRCFRIWHTADPKLLPNTLVTKWVKVLADYYENTMEAFHNIKEIPSIKLFSVPDNVSDDDVSYVQDIFSGDSLSKNNKVKEKTHRLLCALAEYAKLIYYVISYLRVIDQLLEVFKKIGEIEAKDPSRCAGLYRLFDELSTQIVRQTDLVGDKFELMAEVGGRRWVSEEELLLNVDRDLEGIGEYIKNKSHYVRNRRSKFDAKQLAMELGAIHDQTKNIVDTIRDACGFMPDAPSTASRSVSLARSESASTVETEKSVLQAVLNYPRLPLRAPTRRGSSNAVPTWRAGQHRPSVITRISPPPVFSERLKKIFDDGMKKAPSQNNGIKLLYGMCDLLGDYTGRHAKVPRLTELGRHNIADIVPQVTRIETALLTITEASAKILLENELRELLALRDSPVFSHGTLRDRIALIECECAKHGFYPAQEPRGMILASAKK
ncbi:MAG: hypothetical protein Q8L78_07240 [Coxiellaceae bacterium]|nr:hypothetical protein [Coxiellaceae bacterium]